MTGNYFDFNNSNLPNKSGKGAKNYEWIIPTVIAAFAAIILLDALHLPQSLSGRLHPAVTPAAIAFASLAIALRLLIPPGAAAGKKSEQDMRAAPLRTIIMAVAAVVFLSISVRQLGVVASVAIGGALAASGVPGVRPFRAALIGVALGALAGAVFVVALRQPLPLWPSWAQFI